MAEGQPSEQPWLSLTEAASLTGLDREAIRARARRGVIPYRQGNRGQWLVQLPADLTAASDKAEGTAAADFVADLQAELVEVRIALARAVAERDAAKAVAVAEMVAEAAEAKAENRLLRESLDRERARADRFEELLRQPWWRRLLGK